MYKVPVGLTKLLVVLTDKSADGVIGVLGIQLTVLGAVGDGGDATCFVIAIGKLTAALENLALTER